jgi:hypothetical protein
MRGPGKTGKQRRVEVIWRKKKNKNLAKKKKNTKGMTEIRKEGRKEGKRKE